MLEVRNVRLGVWRKGVIRDKSLYNVRHPCDGEHDVICRFDGMKLISRWPAWEMEIQLTSAMHFGRFDILVPSSRPAQ